VHLIHIKVDAVYNVRKAIQQFKKNREKTLDFFATLKTTCYSIFPKSVVIPIVSEITVFYYGFIYWKKRDIKENEFSYHKTSGTIGLLSGVILIYLENPPALQVVMF